MKIIKAFKNNELLTFIEDNKIKIYIDDNYEQFNRKKGYKINLISSNKGSYKGSFANNYICKKFRSNQKLNLTNIETNKILNYCKYFLLSQNEYIKFFPKDVEYDYSWLRSSKSGTTLYFHIMNKGKINYNFAFFSYGFIFCFLKKRIFSK